MDIMIVLMCGVVAIFCLCLYIVEPKQNRKKAEKAVVRTYKEVKDALHEDRKES